MASAAVVAQPGAAKADDKKESIITSVSQDSDGFMGGGNDSDEKNDNSNAGTKNGKRVSRQASAPAASVKVSFKKNSMSNKKQNNNSNNNGANGETGTELPTYSEGKNEDDGGMLRAASLPPNLNYDPCREFDSFAGDWVDSKGQPVLISAWGVIRYPNNPKLRFEAVNVGPNHLSVTFDRDPKRRKFVGKLNHNCDVLIWSNDTKWSRKGTQKPENEVAAVNAAPSKTNDGGNKTPSIEENAPQNEAPNKLNRQGSCLVM